jgi:hypothetical protein
LSNIRAKNGSDGGSYIGSTVTWLDSIVIPVEAPMSAALALDIELDPLSGLEGPVSPSPPSLRLVPTGPDVEPVMRRIPLSRRGRLARTVGLIGVATALAWALVSTVTAGASALQHTVTVEAGQTLSAIAAREFPDTPVTDAVAWIQLANGLSSSDVHTGQVLQIPAAG